MELLQLTTAETAALLLSIKVALWCTVVSHAINEVFDLTQQLAVIQNGVISAFGDFHEVFKHDQLLALARSLGLDNLLQATLTAKHADLGHCLGRCGNHDW